MPSCFNSLITLGPRRSDPTFLAELRCALLQKHSWRDTQRGRFGVRTHPAESWPDLGLHWMHIKLPPCCDMQHYSGFTSIILFSWWWEAKIAADVKIRLIAQPSAAYASRACIIIPGYGSASCRHLLRSWDIVRRQRRKQMDWRFSSAKDDNISGIIQR